LHCSILGISERVSTCAVAEHRNDVVSVLPDTPIVDSVHQYIPGIAPEHEGFHHSHDTFIGQSVAEGGSSGNIVPSE